MTGGFHPLPERIFVHDVLQWTYLCWLAPSQPAVAVAAAVAAAVTAAGIEAAVGALTP